jgi:tetratricopeptide (TPR) repeat protein
VVTLGVERIHSFDLFPFSVRIANALIAYVGYISKMIWPRALACIYPYPQNLPVWKATVSGFLLVFISIAAVRTARQRPYFSVGWLWYVGTLVPVIGLVQVGPQAMADRYTYVPLIGLFILLAWGVPDILPKWRRKRVVLAVSAGVVLSALTVCAWIQVGHWQNSVTLFKHAIKVTDDNWLAHTNLGKAFFERHQRDTAIYHYRRALVIKPDFVPALYNMGKALSDSGHMEQAAWFYRQTLLFEPDYTGAHNNLGNILAAKGSFDDAVRHYQEALRISPENADSHNNLANVRVAMGQFEAAVRHYTEAVRINPGYANTHFNLGNLLAEMPPDSFKKALDYFSGTIHTDPGYAIAYYQIGVRLARQGNRQRADNFFLKAAQLDPAYLQKQETLK